MKKELSDKTQIMCDSNIKCAFTYSELPANENVF